MGGFWGGATGNTGVSGLQPGKRGLSENSGIHRGSSDKGMTIPLSTFSFTLSQSNCGLGILEVRPALVALLQPSLEYLQINLARLIISDTETAISGQVRTGKVPPRQNQPGSYAVYQELLAGQASLKEDSCRKISRNRFSGLCLAV
jgi:hypothetical protein